MKRSLRSPLRAGALTLLLVFQAAARSKPSVAVPPFAGQGAESARTAIASEFKAAGDVVVVDGKRIDQYLASRSSRPVGGRPDAQAGAWLKKGQEAYRQLKMGQAIEALSKAKVLFRNASSDEESFSGLRAAQFYLAMTYLAKGERSRASEELREVVVLDPQRYSRKISTKLYPPNVVTLYESVRKEVRKTEHGGLDISSAPSGALAYVDGGSVGLTPAHAAELPLGEHFVRVELDGRQTFAGSKFIVAGENRMDVELKALSTEDPLAYFKPVEGKGMDHLRASFLDEMGLALGADILVFLEPGEASVRGQLYDQRSQEISPIESGTTPAALVSKLRGHIGDDGYVVPEAERPSAKVPPPLPPQALPNPELPPNLAPQPTSTLSEQSKPPLSTPNAPGEARQWYENPWVWAGVAGVLLLAGGSVLVFTDVAKGDPTTSTLTVGIP